MTGPVRDDLRMEVWKANLALVEAGLVTDTFGNVSAVDRTAGILLIKPSGVPYADMGPEDMVPVSLESGLPLGGELRPSSDTLTHLALYRAFPCGAVAHTHSEAATVLAQARLPIRCLGTTHADYFRGDVPVTRELSPREIAEDYEVNTGKVIVETVRGLEQGPEEIPAILVANHGPFTWGRDAPEAVKHSLILEFVARMDCTLRSLHAGETRPHPDLVDKHFFRKHGDASYYGQD